MSSRALRRRSTYRAINGHQKEHSRPILRITLVLFVVFMMITSGASAATLLFYGENLPTLHNFKARFDFQNTHILDKNGHLLYDLADLSKSRGKRVVEPLVFPGQTTAYYNAHGENWLVGSGAPGIPKVLQDATIATEDATFYNNPGFDPLSIARAEFDNVTTGRVVSGASTITQQLIKRYLLTPDPTISRKFEEIVLAYELTQKYPKSKILWYYLNSVSYGNVSIGAQAAAKTYFKTNVWQLDQAQAAFLAGLPQAPTTYNPVDNRQAAIGRMRQVLQLMYSHGYLRNAKGQLDYSLVQKDVNEIQTKWPKFTPPTTFNRYPHFVEYAIQQLTTLQGNVPALKGKIFNGLDVYTTLDPSLQDHAQGIVKNQVSQLGGLNVTDGALVSMDLQRGPNGCYGCIRAMVGSADYHNVQISGQINMANSPRQPGSSFKPFNYIYAFENGLGPATTVDDAPVDIPDVGNPADGGVYSPTDYDLTWHGYVTLRVALQNSLNVPAVKVEQYNADSGGSIRDTVEATAIKLGISSLKADNPNCCGWALTLGGMEHGVRLVEETDAYGAFATGGHKVAPIAVRRVVDRSTGKVLYDAQSTMNAAWRQQVIPPADAYIMNNVLSDNASRCTPAVCEFGLDSKLYLGRTAAAKTGTTNSYTDNWTVGYTPDLVTGVWVGNADNSQMAAGTTGVTGAAPIWHDFMLEAFKELKLPPKDFVQPPYVYYGSTCRQPSGYGGYVLSSFSYDVYAGIIPYCSVGTVGSSASAPSSTDSSTQPPAYTPPVSPPVAAPTQYVPPPTLAPVIQPTAVPVVPAQPIATTPPVIQPTVAAPVQPPAVQPTQ